MDISSNGPPNTSSHPFLRQQGLSLNLNAPEVASPAELIDKAQALLYKQFGGAQWNPLLRHIFEEECALAYAPRVVPFGVSMLGPVLQKFGTAAQ